MFLLYLLIERNAAISLGPRSYMDKTKAETHRSDGFAALERTRAAVGIARPDAKGRGKESKREESEDASKHFFFEQELLCSAQEGR